MNIFKHLKAEPVYAWLVEQPCETGDGQLIARYFVHLLMKDQKTLILEAEEAVSVLRVLEKSRALIEERAEEFYAKGEDLSVSTETP